ncbi:MAG: leucine-rich repeat protein, partial [Oscillospiraceae bacterium]
LGKVFYKYKGTMPKDTEINIKAGTVSITDDAFSGCTGLKNVTIPDSVTYIGKGAFEGTSFYNSLPDGEVYLGKVFYKYKGTMPQNTEITIKSGIISITDYAFDHCKGLKSVIIPNSVTSIGNYAFDTCTSLTSVIIPDSVTSIGNCAFQVCTGLKSVIIGNSVTSIGWGAFQVCTGLKGVIIPNSVTRIGTFAFWDCTGLKGVTIPDSVTSIGSMAFGYFMNGGEAQLPGFTITGTKGSAAEKYATANGFNFQLILALGDVNGDGRVTSGDAIAVLRAEAQLRTLTAEEFTAADVVKDNRVTSGDAIRILRYEAQLVDKL